MLCLEVSFMVRTGPLALWYMPTRGSHPLTYMPPRIIELSYWNDSTCDYPIFSNSQLYEMYHFDINSRADNDGYICISTGDTNQHVVLCQYSFHPEKSYFSWCNVKRDGLSKTCARNVFKLTKHMSYAVELLRVCHLLVNIYNCLKGDSASSYNWFDCSPMHHALDQYLT
jgi:hypothetical protein